MAFGNAWIETDPDGSIITVSQLDNSDRLIKAAVRERLEGDPADPDLTGLIEVGSFTNAPKPRKGAARVYVDTAANILLFGATKREDGRLAVSSDTKRLYHVAGAAVVELAYLPTTGGTMTGLLTTTTLTTGGLLTLGGNITRAADVSIDLTGAATRTLLITNSTGGQVCNVDADGTLAFRNNTAFTMTMSGTPTAARVITFPDATDTVVLLTANQVLTTKTLTAPTINAATTTGLISHTPAVGGKGLVINTVAQVTDQPILDLAQTWNAGGVVFNAIKLDVTNTASAAGSNLLVMSVGGNTRFAMDKSGNLTLNMNGGTPSFIMQAGAATRFTIQWNGANDIEALAVNALYLSANNTASNGLIISGASAKVKLNSNGGLVCANAALGTASVTGFLYAPSCAGLPSGVPVAEVGTIPFVIDSTNSQINCYIGGVWKKVTVV